MHIVTYEIPDVGDYTQHFHPADIKFLFNLITYLDRNAVPFTHTFID